MSFDRVVSGVLAFLALFVSAWPAWAHVPIPPKKGEPPRKIVQQPVADFTAVDQDGNTFRFSQMRGKAVLVTFVFTTCPDVCPLLSAKFASIQRALDERTGRYRLLTITTDPERDTPAVLKSYGARYGADFRRWRFISGTPEQLAAIWKIFGVNVTRTRSGQVRHTALTTLVDGNGVRRIDYYTDRWQEQQILKDMTWLEAQSNP